MTIKPEKKLRFATQKQGQNTKTKTPGVTTNNEPIKNRTATTERTTDSAVVKTPKLFSWLGGFLTYTMYHMEIILLY